MEGLCLSGGMVRGFCGDSAGVKQINLTNIFLTVFDSNYCCTTVCRSTLYGINSYNIFSNSSYSISEEMA